MSIKVINPEQYKRMRESEGIRREDVWTGVDDPLTEEELDDLLVKVPQNIREDVNEKKLNTETKKLLHLARNFCTDLSEEFKKTFLSLLSDYMQVHSQLSEDIFSYLERKEFNLPNFIISYGKDSATLLKELDLEGQIYNDEGLLIVFQLPKPLAQFWWKGGAESWGEYSEDVSDIVIEWGYFYRELMPVVWEKQGYYENEEDLNFERVNNVGQHDPQKYYYVWEISKLDER